MEQKLNPGDNFPHINLDIVGGESLQIPQDLGGQFNIVLFYRGHWWPYCRRLLAGYEALIDQFKELGTEIVAASVDDEKKTSEVAEPLSFPIGYGVTRSQADLMGSWWDETRDFIQPSEFIISKSGKLMTSAYSNSPVGRMDPKETLTLLKFLADRKNNRLSWRQDEVQLGSPTELPSEASNPCPLTFGGLSADYTVDN